MEGQNPKRRADAVEAGDVIVDGPKRLKVHSAKTVGDRVEFETTIYGWGGDPDAWSTDYRERFEVVTM